MNAFLFDPVAQLYNSLTDCFLTYVQMKSLLDFTDGKIRLFVYHLVDRIQVLPGQLSLAAPLIDTKIYAAGLFHLLAQSIDRPQTY